MKTLSLFTFLFVGALAQAAGSDILEIKTDAELEALLVNSKKIPVVIDFSGKDARTDKKQTDEDLTWCPPCRRFHPAFEAAAKAYRGKAIFVQVNIHHDWKVSEPPMGKSLFDVHGLQGVPTVVLFNKGTTRGGEVALDYSNVSDGPTFIKQVAAALKK